MEGEDEESDDEAAFGNKPVWKRILVVVMGAVMNIILGIAPVSYTHLEEAGVTLLIETNGVYADTSRLRKLLEQLSSDAVAALWDMHHPYRFMGEQPEETVQNLGAYIKYVHVKDSVMQDGQVQYRMMGEGDLPIREMMRALQSICYEDVYKRQVSISFIL